MADGTAPELRLSDSQREDVVAQLGLAMSEGRLDVAEYEERSRQVYAAKVPSDLTGVLDGLPITTPAVQPVRATTEPSSGNRWFLSLFGDRVQRGNIDMGDKATSLSLLGDSTFDLTQVTATEVDLRVITLIGDTTILVRPGTVVSANVIVLLGDRKEDAPPTTSDATMQVRLRVVTLIGDVKIRVVEI